ELIVFERATSQCATDQIEGSLVVSSRHQRCTRTRLRVQPCRRCVPRPAGLGRWADIHANRLLNREQSEGLRNTLIRRFTKGERWLGDAVLSRLTVATTFERQLRLPGQRCEFCGLQVIDRILSGATRASFPLSSQQHSNWSLTSRRQRRLASKSRRR